MTQVRFLKHLRRRAAIARHDGADIIVSFENALRSHRGRAATLVLFLKQLSLRLATNIALIDPSICIKLAIIIFKNGVDHDRAVTNGPVLLLM